MIKFIFLGKSSKTKWQTLLPYVWYTSIFCILILTCWWSIVLAGNSSGNEQGTMAWYSRWYKSSKYDTVLFHITAVCEIEEPTCLLSHRPLWVCVISKHVALEECGWRLIINRYCSNTPMCKGAEISVQYGVCLSSNVNSKVYICFTIMLKGETHRKAVLIRTESSCCRRWWFL